MWIAYGICRKIHSLSSFLFSWLFSMIIFIVSSKVRVLFVENILNCKSFSGNTACGSTHSQTFINNLSQPHCIFYIKMNWRRYLEIHLFRVYNFKNHPPPPHTASEGMVFNELGGGGSKFFILFETVPQKVGYLTLKTVSIFNSAREKK